MAAGTPPATRPPASALHPAPCSLLLPRPPPRAAFSHARASARASGRGPWRPSSVARRRPSLPTCAVQGAGYRVQGTGRRGHAGPRRRRGTGCRVPLVQGRTGHRVPLVQGTGHRVLLVQGTGCSSRSSGSTRHLRRRAPRRCILCPVPVLYLLRADADRPQTALPPRPLCLRPAPCTVPVPCTLHPVPCPCPCTLHRPCCLGRRHGPHPRPAPCTLYPAQALLPRRRHAPPRPVPCTLYPAQAILADGTALTHGLRAAACQPGQCCPEAHTHCTYAYTHVAAACQPGQCCPEAHTHCTCAHMHMQSAMRAAAQRLTRIAHVHMGMPARMCTCAHGHARTHVHMPIYCNIHMSCTYALCCVPVRPRAAAGCLI